MKQQTDLQKKIVLHFNLCQTIMLFDPQAPYQTKEECLQQILVGYAWGKLEQKDEKSPVQWKQAHPNFTQQCPQEGMMSYKDYINQQYPLKNANDEANPERLQEYNNQIIHQRQGLYYQFVKPGSPCLKLKPEYDRIVKLITVPKVILEEIKMRQEELGDPKTPKSNSKRNLSSLLQEKDTLMDLFTEGKFNLIPNFYKTMMNLKKLKREFAIVFRPFGTDFYQILREFNRFCIGDHPCFSGRNNTPLVKFDGSKGTKNYIIQDKQCGLFYRFDKDVQSTQLALGSLRRVDKKKSLEDEYEKEIEEEAVVIQKNLQGIYVQTMELLKESCALCFQDDYDFYQENTDSPAKLLLLDQTDYDTLHIFFEESQNDENNVVLGIVDAVSGEKLIKKKSHNKYQIQVDIIEAIKDPDYFIKLIDTCEKLRADEIDRIEKGIPEDQPDIPKKTDYEILQEASDSEYLRRTILPLLQTALKLVDIERPLDPISFIATYCLKNKDQIKIPVPTQEYLDSLNEKLQQENQEKN